MLQKSQGHLGCIPKPVVNMDVSENSGTPKSSILIGFSIINHPFWGTPIFEATYQPPKQLVEFQSPDFSGFFQIWASSLMEIMQDFGEKFPSWHGAQWKIGWSKSRGIFSPPLKRGPSTCWFWIRHVMIFAESWIFSDKKNVEFVLLKLWSCGHGVFLLKPPKLPWPTRLCWGELNIFFSSPWYVLSP